MEENEVSATNTVAEAPVVAEKSAGDTEAPMAEEKSAGDTQASMAAEAEKRAGDTEAPVTEEAENCEGGNFRTAERKSFGEKMKEYFSATRISFLAVFTALAFVLRLPWFEFYIIPAVSFLKVDFSGVFVMIAGFALGPVAGIVVSVLKEILYGVAFSQTVGVGEVANILIMLPYILIPTVCYKKFKGIKAVLITLVTGSVIQVIWSVPVNYLLTFPFYLNLYSGVSWADGMSFYLTVWYWAVLFNFVKTVLISAVTLVIYKPLSKLIKVTNAKFEKRKKA